MQTVMHKNFGRGEVVGKEVKANTTMIAVQFENGKKTKFALPESFLSGFLEAEGSLKTEVDAAIVIKQARDEEAKAKIEEQVMTFVQRSNAKRFGRRSPKKYKFVGAIAKDYQGYLIGAGYREKTIGGNPSTVAAYVRAVDKVLEEEGITAAELKRDIVNIVSKYDEGGPKADFGAKSNKTVINALKRFQEFVE